MKSHKLKFALFITVVLGGIVTAKMIGVPTLYAWMQQFTAYVHQLGVWGMIIYALVFALACLFALPAMPLTIGAGVVFGFGWGLLTAMAGAALAGSLGFLIARYLARDEIADKLKGHPKFQAIDTAIGREGWKIIGLLRMCPFPYGLTNYLYGLTSIAFVPYLVATLAGIFPSIGFFVYLGAAGKASLDAAGKMEGQPPGIFIMLGVGLIAGVTALVFVGRLARAAVAKASLEGPPVSPGELTRTE